ncbi:MAG: sigma-54-dependent transcriptional regulator [Alphaproteobacteria bacterium]|jgi:two-component system response regulator FlrC
MKILVLGKPSGNLSIAIRIATQKGASVSHFTDFTKAIEILCLDSSFRLIIIETSFDIASFKTLLDNEKISTDIIACGENTSIEEATKAIKAGAKEFLPLPPKIEKIALILEAIAKPQTSEEIIYQSPLMQKIMKVAEQVAPSTANILITGESGTGKEVISKFIHQKSKRANKELVSVNCAAIPENLIESELFGHEKGAFTGANNLRIGKFEEASGGTLLLDEISEMDFKLQAKLLRAIQEKEINRIGGNKPIKIDLRIISTSNRQLKEEVKKNTFRQDLLFRLNVMHIELPPLRDRKEDVLSLAQTFISKYSRLNNFPQKPLSDEARKKLIQYNWPGNIRELENTMHRAILLSDSNFIEEKDLMLFDEGALNDKVKSLKDVEREAIVQTINSCLGDNNYAASILGITIAELKDKLKEYRLGG